MKELKPYEALLDTYPLLRLLLPLIAGIIAGDCCGGLPADWACFLSGVPLLCGVLMLVVRAWPARHDRKSWPFLLLLNVGVMAVGMLLQTTAAGKVHFQWPSGVRYFRAMVADAPKEKEKIWSLKAQVLEGPGSGRFIQVGLMKRDSLSSRSGQSTYGDEQVRLQPGDVLWLHTEVRTPVNIGNPGDFDYASWLRRQGVSGTAFCFAGHWLRSDAPFPHLPLSVRALRWRDALVRQYAVYFEGRTLAVLSAMTLGDKTRLDTSTREMYSHTGVSHILALSGLHLSILFGFFQLGVMRFIRRRWVAVAASVLGLSGVWLFVLLAGMPLSLVRAAVMYSVMLLATCVRRDYLSVNSLALAALVLLLFSPQSLFDVGFQLSCLSVLAIVLFARSVPRPAFMGRWRLTRWLADGFSVTLCAQLATAPLVAYYFHTFPVYGFLANFIAIPFAYGILLLSLVFFVFPFLREGVAVAVEAAMRVMDVSLAALSSWPGAVIEWWPAPLTVGLVYGVLIFSVAYLLRRTAFRLYAVAGFLAAVAGMELWSRHTAFPGPRLVFYHSRAVPVVHAMLSPQMTYLWTPSPQLAGSALKGVERNYWKPLGLSAPQWLPDTVRMPAVVCRGDLFSFCGRRVALVHGRMSRWKPASPLKVDYLMLSRGSRSGLEDILKFYCPARLILDATLTDFYRSKYLREAAGFHLPVHDMAREGALCVAL